METVHNKMTPLVNEFAVSETLGVSVATVRRWRLLGAGPRFLKIGAAVRYRPEDLTTWLDSRPAGGSAQENRQTEVNSRSGKGGRRPSAENIAL
jgi:hypothetical protein